MNIVIVNHSPIPVYAYGGTERVIWDLGKALVEQGHQVTFLVPQGSQCDFAQVQIIVPHRSWQAQIPDNTDVVHFQFHPEFTQDFTFPYVITEHGNSKQAIALDQNTIFVSKNHASRHGSTCYVLNGLDWNGYGLVNWQRPRQHYHFLGKAAWRVKNVQGAIDVAKKDAVELNVLGGKRLNIKRGFRCTLSPKIHFHGMVGGQQKLDLLNSSCGLILPVRWHEPFGLAFIESLYFGCPVFATPYGALPELIPAECGVLSVDTQQLADAVQSRKFERQQCHEHAVNHFNSALMASGYLQKYRQVLQGQVLNSVSPCMQITDYPLVWT